MRVDVYSRHDAYLATLGPGELLGFVHTDELNGEDSVDVTTTFALAEGMRLVWRDNRGTAHEHVCQDPKGERKGGATVYSDTALNSICELFGDYIVDKRPYGYSFANALQVALEPTRWAMGAVDQPGTVSSGLTFYHTSAREALNAILECGGELETVVEVSNGGVSARKACIRRHRGDAAGHRRFANGKDLIKAERTEHWGAITACYGYGKGMETDSGGHGRKLTFGDVNGGKDYVADAAALKAYGRPDGNGGMAHVFGTYENSDCEDAAQLLAETRAYLAEHKVPGVTYKVDVADLVAMGRTWEGVGVGDDVQIVDTCFSPALRCEGRVTKLVTDCLGGTCKVTLGNVTETFADMFAQQQQAVSSLSRRSSSWDVAANTPAAYLQQLLSGLNERFNLAGMSYMHASFEHGLITASVPLDENGNPTKTPASAMQMCSQGFRIASSTKADGTFDWQTFGTGEGFFANLIVAGILDAGLIKAGILQDAAGKNFINMETGDCRLASTTTLDGKSIATSDTVQALDNALDQSELFNRLTNNGATQGIYMQNGLLYINATYLATGIISDKKGRNKWNLTSGELTTDYMTANHITANGTFKCGYSNYYTMLNSSGQMAGYRAGATSNTRRVGFIDYNASVHDISSDAILYGLQLQSEGIIRMSTPKVSISTSSSTSVTTTNAGTGSVWLAGFESEPPDKWDIYTMKALHMSFINGICTRNF